MKTKTKTKNEEEEESVGGKEYIWLSKIPKQNESMFFETNNKLLNR